MNLWHILSVNYSQSVWQNLDISEYSMISLSNWTHTQTWGTAADRKEAFKWKKHQKAR